MAGAKLYCVRVWKMNCPACLNKMKKARSKDVVVDICPNCRGIWFDAEEFGPIARGLAEKMDSSLDPGKLFKPREVPPAYGLNEGPRMCPVCSTGLHLFNYAYDSNICLDKCDSCGGIWTDRGEIHKVAAHLKGDPRVEAIGKCLLERQKEMDEARREGDTSMALLLLGPRLLPIGDDQPAERFPFVTIGIIVVSAICFALSMWVASSPSAIFETYGHKPADFFSISLITCMFLHGGIFHIGGNMLFLWIFGDNVEDRFGRLWFGFFYLAAGFAATVTHSLVNMGSTIPCIGGSGAISGVMGAYLILVSVQAELAKSSADFINDGTGRPFK